MKIGVDYHLKLHALKLLSGKRLSEAVEEALECYFEKVKLEREALARARAEAEMGPHEPSSLPPLA
ncbi:MAG: hypothetical protein ACYDCK_12810 [Thermoplasmatota archaeon]